jgi:hypothetical protein
VQVCFQQYATWMPAYSTACEAIYRASCLVQHTENWTMFLEIHRLSWPECLEEHSPFLQTSKHHPYKAFQHHAFKDFKYWWSSFSAFSSYTTSKNLCILLQTLYSALL